MPVTHDEKAQKFVLELEDEAAATLSYQRRGDVLNFYYVFVPPSHRGRGVAGRVIVAGFDYARQQNLRVVPSCPYIRHQFLPRFPQYQDLVLEPSDE